MVSASVTHAIVFGLFKQGPKRGPAFQTFKDEIRSFPGPKNLRLFFRKSLKKNNRLVVPVHPKPAFMQAMWRSTRKPPEGGRTALRVQSSNVWFEKHIIIENL